MKTETKDLEMETCPREGVVKKEKLHTMGNTLTGVSVGSCGVNWSITGKKKKPHRIHT